MIDVIFSYLCLIWENYGSHAGLMPMGKVARCLPLSDLTFIVAERIITFFHFFSDSLITKKKC